MDKRDGELEDDILQWQRGQLSLDSQRKLPSKIGRADYGPGIPVLFELSSSEDPIVRYNVVMSLAFKLQHRQAKALMCRLLIEDPDEDCRDVAAAGLGYLFSNSRDCSLITLFGRVAINDSDEDVRRSAFSALLRVSGRANEEEILLQRPPVDETTIRTILAECPQETEKSGDARD